MQDNDTKIRILGISGSPRKGATEYALREALTAAEAVPEVQTDLWTVRGKKIEYCIHCDRCRREKSQCWIDDDMPELIDKMVNADGFIIASPVYGMNISAQLQACLNRTRPIHVLYGGVFRNKVGGAIALGGTRHGGQESAIQGIINFYLMKGILVCGGIGGCYSGGKVWTKDAKEQGAKEDTVGMNTVRGLGRGVAEAAMIASIGREIWDRKAKELGLQEAEPVQDHDWNR